MHANRRLVCPMHKQWDDAPGRMTRNGLGSLEIGAGKTRVDE